PLWRLQAAKHRSARWGSHRWSRPERKRPTPADSTRQEHTPALPADRTSRLRLFPFLIVLGEEPFDEPGIEVPCPEVRVGEDLAVQRDCRVNALDDEHPQSARHAGDRLIQVF